MGQLADGRVTFGTAVMVVAVGFLCSCSGGHPRAASSSNLPAGPGASTTFITVPDVVGQVNFETAQMAVARANLLTAYRLEHSSIVVAGSVMGETPAEGSRVPAGTTVTLVVSIGPANILGAQPCQAAHLSVQPGPPVSEATGQHTRDWSFTNLAAPCVLDGYPAVSALDQDRRVLGYAYTHSGDQMTTGATPQPVYLPEGSAAWIRMNKYRCDIAVGDTTTTFQLSMPSGGGTLDIPGSLDYCADAPSLTIAVSPFEPVEMLLGTGHAT